MNVFPQILKTLNHAKPLCNLDIEDCLGRLSFWLKVNGDLFRFASPHVYTIDNDVEGCEEDMDPIV